MKTIYAIPFWQCCGSLDPIMHTEGCKESKLYNPQCKWGTLKEQCITYSEPDVFTKEMFEKILDRMNRNLPQ